MYILYLLTVYPVICTSFTPLITQIQEGEKRFNQLVSQKSLYGPCWTDALVSLESQCTELTEETHRQLALSFANCFLESTGHQRFDCSAEPSILSCMKSRSFDDRTFHAYSTFFTHTQSICHYLSSDLWQRRTESTVNRLTETSADTLKAMSSIRQMQREIIDDMSNQMQSSQVALRSLETTLSERNSIELDILKGYREIQQYILIEINKFYSVFFYLGTAIVIYFVTTPKRTHEARLIVYILLAINLYCERQLISITYSSGTHLLAKYLSVTDTMENVWFCRFIFAVIGVCILFYYWYTYNDFNHHNNQLLRSITYEMQKLSQQVAEVKTLQLYSGTSPPASPRPKVAFQVSQRKAAKLCEMSSDESDHVKLSDDSDFESDVPRDDEEGEEEKLPDHTVDRKPDIKSTKVSTPRTTGLKSPVPSPVLSPPAAGGETPSKVSNPYSLRPRCRQVKDTSFAFFSSDEE